MEHKKKITDLKKSIEKFNDFSTANTGYTLFEMGTRSNDDIFHGHFEP